LREQAALLISAAGFFDIFELTMPASMILASFERRIFFFSELFVGSAILKPSKSWSSSALLDARAAAVALVFAAKSRTIAPNRPRWLRGKAAG